MGEREFLVYLDEAQENRYRHRHAWEQEQIIEFRIQYEALIEGVWRAIVRYDSAHGQPHRDILHPDGSQTKQMFPYYTNTGYYSAPSFRATEGSRGISCRSHICHCEWRFLDSLRSLGMTYQESLSSDQH